MQLHHQYVQLLYVKLLPRNHHEVERSVVAQLSLKVHQAVGRTGEPLSLHQAK